MRNEEDGRPALLKRFDVSKAFGLKLGITNGQRFVNDQNIRIRLCLHSESKSDTHAARIRFNRLVDEISDARKIKNTVETLLDLLIGKSEQCAVHINIFTPSEFRIETRAKFQQRGDAPVGLYTAAAGVKRAANEL